MGGRGDRDICAAEGGATGDVGADVGGDDGTATGGNVTTVEDCDIGAAKGDAAGHRSRR